LSQSGESGSCRHSQMPARSSVALRGRVSKERGRGKRGVRGGVPEGASVPEAVAARGDAARGDRERGVMALGGHARAHTTRGWAHPPSRE
jgi:hypothetical protein